MTLKMTTWLWCNKSEIHFLNGVSAKQKYIFVCYGVEKCYIYLFTLI